MTDIITKIVRKKIALYAQIMDADRNMDEWTCMACKGTGVKV